MLSLLRREREFRRLWTGLTVSQLGDQVTMLALPLAAVLALDASPGEMGVLVAAQWLPYLLLALPAGLWVDRRRSHRRIMLGADAGRALALASVPVAFWLGALTFAHLVAAAFALGTLSLLFQVSYSVFFLRVVPRRDVVEANGALSVSRSVSFVGGPAGAGLLVQALGAPVALLADALSYLASAAFIRGIRVEEPPVELGPGESARRRLAEGFRFLFGNDLLRAMLGCFATINFFTFAFNAIVVLFMSRELGLSAAAIGIILGAGALGGLAGAALGPAIGRRVGMGRAIVLGAILFPAPLLLFPLAAGPTPVMAAMLVAGEFLAGFGVMVLDIHGNSLGLLLTPERLRPRQTATFTFVNYGVRPLGALAGGLAGTVIGLQPALVIGAVGALFGVLWLLASPVPAVREAAAIAVSEAA